MVDLEHLRDVRAFVQREGRPVYVGIIDEAIREIGEARTVRTVGEQGSPALAIAREAFALAQKLATGFVSVISEKYERGPSPEARLVAYRCAALSKLAGNFTDDATKSGEYRCAMHCEAHAHAMLAAERHAGSK